MTLVFKEIVSGKHGKFTSVYRLAMCYWYFQIILTKDVRQAEDETIRVHNDIKPIWLSLHQKISKEF
jgi:hypothetical protein